MINHARTLLLNTRALPAGAVQDPGETYIDPAFSPVAYVGKLKAMQSLLVPPAPSRAVRNFYVYAMLRLVHAPDYDKYTRTFDARLTYSDDFSPYVGEEFAAAVWPSLNLDTLYTAMSSNIYGGGVSLFDMCPAQASDLAQFKDIWHGALSFKDRISAGILATYYAMEAQR